MIFMLFIWHQGWQSEIAVDAKPFPSMVECRRALPPKQPGITVTCFMAQRKDFHQEWSPSCAFYRFRGDYPVCRASWKQRPALRLGWI
jgi:hypothetical protein